MARSQYGARVLTKIRLYEFSPVSVPANGGCDIVGVKAGDVIRGRTLEEHTERTWRIWRSTSTG